MKLEVRDVYNGFETKYQDEIANKWVVEGENLRECFKKTYPSYRSNRYASGHRTEFANSEIQKLFLDYCHNVPLSEYYGNATVD